MWAIRLLLTALTHLSPPLLKPTRQQCTYGTHSMTPNSNISLVIAHHTTLRQEARFRSNNRRAARGIKQPALNDSAARFESMHKAVHFEYRGSNTNADGYGDLSVHARARVPAGPQWPCKATLQRLSAGLQRAACGLCVLVQVRVDDQQIGPQRPLVRSEDRPCGGVVQRPCCGVLQRPCGGRVAEAVRRRVAEAV